MDITDNIKTNNNAAPESDDLLYGEDVRAALAASPSLGTLLRAAGEKVAHHHQVAHGRYANTFFGSAFLGAFGLDHYWSVPVLLLLSLIGGTLLFTLALLVCTLRVDKWTWLALSMFALLFCVQLLPSPAEGLFGFCGGLGYTLYYGAALSVLALLLLMRAAKRRGARMICGVLAAVLSGVLAGLGFTLLFIVSALMIGFIVLAMQEKRRDLLVVGLLTLLVFAAGTLVQLTAPATSVRAAWEQEMYGYVPSGPVKAVLLSFVYAFCTLLHRLDGGMLLYRALVSLLLAPFLKLAACRFRAPWLIALISFCLYATMFTASLYSTSSMGPYRQWNVMYFMMFPFWGVISAYMTGAFLRRMETRPDGAARYARLCADASQMAKRRFALVVLCGVLMLSSVVIHGVYETTAVAALQEMRSGSAAQRLQAYDAWLDGTVQERADAGESRLYLY